jgi:CRP/FNR family nitrogen fixation transcriptional regulator
MRLVSQMFDPVHGPTGAAIARFLYGEVLLRRFSTRIEHQSYAESVDGAGLRVLRPTDAGNFAQRLLGLALRRFACVQRHLLLLGRMSANERMAQFLLDLLDRQGSDDIINLPMQRNDIADYLGITFETVSRVLRVLKDRRVIRLNSVEQIEVLNVDELAALAA